MINQTRLILLIFLLISTRAYTQTETLRQNIEHIISSKKAVVGVAINGSNEKDSLSINDARHYPMQSVFKFHIALTMLSEIDKGNFALGQKIEIKKNRLLPGLWSPIRKKYPEGVTLTIAEILEYTITLSDNVGCDVLLELLGTPQAVEDYFARNNFKNISIKVNEETMQNNWDLQFQNWITPKESNKILQSFYDNKDSLLSQNSYDFVWRMMKAAQTGKKRLKGQLPEGTVVAHKTGWSGAHKTTGTTAAVNNIGIVFLPNGDHFFISVFITESREDFDTNEKIISDIAKATWNYFINRK
jgi:beta-lactamase class A